MWFIVEIDQGLFDLVQKEEINYKEISYYNITAEIKQNKSLDVLLYTISSTMCGIDRPILYDFIKQREEVFSYFKVEKKYFEQRVERLIQVFEIFRVEKVISKEYNSRS